MDRYVKHFIAMSIAYLVIASVLGVVMIGKPELQGVLKFAHSHLMLLGWVSMMIYGVGYHILPRFAGKLIPSATLPEINFWAANAGLVGMVVFYPLMQYHPEVSAYRGIAVASGVLQVAAMIIFFYNMMITVFSKTETQQPG